MAADADASLAGPHHYDEPTDMPENIRKYWQQRYDIFSRYDEGVQLTEEAWFGVTPEPVANKIATHLSTSVAPKTRILIDAFAGAGGNSIAFARSGRWDQIFAIEKDPSVLACGKHNAKIYGVEKRIWWINGDCFDVLKKRLKGMKGRDKTVVFASPPWGGPGYRDSAVFGLDTMAPYPLEKLYEAFVSFSNYVVLYLPRTSDLNQLAALAGGRDSRQNARSTDSGRLVGEDEEGAGGAGDKVRVTHYCMHGASKALCIFYGDFTFT